MKNNRKCQKEQNKEKPTRNQRASVPWKNSMSGSCLKYQKIHEKKITKKTKKKIKSGKSTRNQRASTPWKNSTCRLQGGGTRRGKQENDYYPFFNSNLFNDHLFLDAIFFISYLLFCLLMLVRKGSFFG